MVGPALLMAQLVEKNNLKHEKINSIHNLFIIFFKIFYHLKTLQKSLFSLILGYITLRDVSGSYAIGTLSDV